MSGRIGYVVPALMLLSAAVPGFAAEVRHHGFQLDQSNRLFVEEQDGFVVVSVVHRGRAPGSIIAREPNDAEHETRRFNQAIDIPDCQRHACVITDSHRCTDVCEKNEKPINYRTHRLRIRNF